jgi:hypothetical protein
MKRLLFAALAALAVLPLAAPSARAQCCNGAFSFSGFCVPGVLIRAQTFSPCCNYGNGFSPCGGAYGGGGGMQQLGPWYLYWPLEAHFQTPAPTGYPYWPSPMALPPGSPGGPPPGLQPVGYQQGPYYWYR